MANRQLDRTDQAHVRSLRDFGSGIEGLRAFYELGARSINQFPKLPYGQVTAKAMHARLQPEMLRQARHFAQAYSRADLSAFFRECRRYKRNPGISLVIRFTSVPRAHRDTFQKNALQEHWTYTRIGSEIRARFGKRKAGGRRRKAPAGSKDAVFKILRATEGWISLHQMLLNENGGYSLRYKLPTRIQAALRLSATLMQNLSHITGWELRETPRQPKPMFTKPRQPGTMSSC